MLHFTSSVSHDDTVAAMQLILGSNYKFQLTGSRFFGTSDNGSDFDFFALDMIGLHELLHQKGWTELIRSSYMTGSDIVHVYRKGMVHLQLVKDFDFKIKVQNAIAPFIVLAGNGASKKTKKLIWQIGTGVLAFAEGLAAKPNDDLRAIIKNVDKDGDLDIIFGRAPF